MLVDLLTDRIPHLPEGKLPGLLFGGEAIVGHAGLTEGFRHFRQVLFRFPGGGRHTQIRQAVAVIIKGVLRLMNKGIRGSLNGSDITEEKAQRTNAGGNNHHRRERAPVLIKNRVNTLARLGKIFSHKGNFRNNLKGFRR